KNSGISDNLYIQKRQGNSVKYSAAESLSIGASSSDNISSVSLSSGGDVLVVSYWNGSTTRLEVYKESGGTYNMTDSTSYAVSAFSMHSESSDFSPSGRMFIQSVSSEHKSILYEVSDTGNLVEKDSIANTQVSISLSNWSEDSFLCVVADNTDDTCL